MISLRLICALSATTFLAANGLALERGFAQSTGPEIIAQNFEPPGAIPGGSPDQSEPGSSDVASLLVRVDRLEDQVRSLTGQIETLQNNQQRLEQELEKFQHDVDFRFQDLSGRRPSFGTQKRSDASGPPDPSLASSDQGASSSGRNDAFDPSAHPDAIGAPRSLGALNESAAPSDQPQGLGDQSDPASVPAAGDQDSAGAPLQLDDSPQANDAALASAGPTGDAGAQDVSPSPNGNSAPTQGDEMAALPASNPREDFDLALVSYNNGSLNQAEAGFQSFISRHPRDRLVPDATFYLGESYWRLGRIPEAAREYLKISTTYATSPHAPESLLKLGVSLEKLGSRPQACASWAQIGRKYPNVSAEIRNAAERDMKRDKC